MSKIYKLIRFIHIVFFFLILALVLTGIYKFCDAVQCNTSFPIQNDQVLMFSNYLLSRKSVQTPKGAYYLLNALKTLSNNQVCCLII
jgi:oligosaccharyltransferase complex subunit delta (ribophorin II)